jgi:hypothetical protein
MRPIDIPLTTTLGRSAVVGSSASFVILALYWLLRRFVGFVHKGRRTGFTWAQLLAGFVVYLLCFSIVGFVGIECYLVACAPPTRLYAEGISGTTVACDRGIGSIALSCSVTIKELSLKSQQIQWSEISAVDCSMRRDGSVQEIRVSAGNKLIVVTSLVLHDLSEPLGIIRDHAPPASSIRGCRSAD